MQRTNNANLSFADFVLALRKHPLRWVVPTVAALVFAVAYALVKPATWEATQALIIRDEATGSTERPGKFRHLDDMKTVQETVLELAKSPAVLRAALVEVGPPADHVADSPWPSDRQVAGLQSSVKLTPPKGAEFGTTEVFYLNVKSDSRERAIALAGAVSRQLQNHFQKLRNGKAQSMIDELTRTVALARGDLNDSTTRLSTIEKSVGRDLAELRILQESPSGDSQLRRTVTEIENELRQVRAAQQSNQELLDLLVAAKLDAKSLMAAPNRLLESQPALRRLKEGLVDAQLRTSQLLGSMNEAHPQVQASLAAQQEVQQNLHHEITAAIEGIQVDQRVTASRLTSLENQLADATGRMAQLAEMRASYANLVAEARHRTEILRTSEQELAEARASQAAAVSSSLIAMIDDPGTGTDPVGPGRTVIALGGLMGGLILGLGIVFLTAQPSQAGALPTIAAGGHHVNGSASDSEGSLSLKQALRKLSRRKPVWN